MLTVIEINTKKICRILLENETYDLIDIYNKGRIVGDIDNPVIGMSTGDDGLNRLIFRELSEEDFVEGTRMFFKKVRDILVSNITISYNGHDFQGDELSQSRISRAIAGMTEDDTVKWKTISNKEVILTKTGLVEILTLAVQEQTRIWFN